MITKALQTKHYTLHNMKLLIVTCTYTTNIMYNTQHRDNCTQQWLRDDSAQSYISTAKRTNGRGPCTVHQYVHREPLRTTRRTPFPTFCIVATQRRDTELYLEMHVTQYSYVS